MSDKFEISKTTVSPIKKSMDTADINSDRKGFTGNGNDLPKLGEAERKKEEVGSAGAVALQQAADMLNTKVQNVQRNIVFSVDVDTGKTLITVKDKLSNEVIRKIPSEEAVKLAQKLRDISGQLFNQKV